MPIQKLLVKNPLWREDIKVPISDVLMWIVGQENRDSEEDDIVQLAAEYIMKLEEEIDRLNGLSV